MLITLDGLPASKKNSKRIYRTRTGKTLVLPSTAYEKWRKKAIGQIIEQHGASRKISNYPVNIIARFQIKNKTNVDMDNMLSSLLDMLQDAYVLDGDSVKHIRYISVRWISSFEEKTIVSIE
jgi:Holliday junction resolvase RusA-like endonuclease